MRSKTNPDLQSRRDTQKIDGKHTEKEQLQKELSKIVTDVSYIPTSVCIIFIFISYLKKLLPVKTVFLFCLQDIYVTGVMYIKLRETQIHHCTFQKITSRKTGRETTIYINITIYTTIRYI